MPVAAQYPEYFDSPREAPECFTAKQNGKVSEACDNAGIVIDQIFLDDIGRIFPAPGSVQHLGNEGNVGIH